MYEGIKKTHLIYPSLVTLRSYRLPNSDLDNNPLSFSAIIARPIS